jgi:hypothetical protein
MRRDLRDWLRFAAVSAYLGAVGVYLLATGRLSVGYPLRELPRRGWRRVRRRLEGGARGTLSAVQPEQGHCYVALIAARGVVSDAEGMSRLLLFEDDHRLGPAHATHDDVRRLGAGRYSHWRDAVYFSASDNSDPRSNGRSYTYSE